MKLILSSFRPGLERTQCHFNTTDCNIAVHNMLHACLASLFSEPNKVLKKYEQNIEEYRSYKYLPVCATNIMMVSTYNNTTLKKYSGQEYSLAMSS